MSRRGPCMGRVHAVVRDSGQILDTCDQFPCFTATARDICTALFRLLIHKEEQPLDRTSGLVSSFLSTTNRVGRDALPPVNLVWGELLHVGARSRRHDGDGLWYEDKINSVIPTTSGPIEHSSPVYTI